MCLDKITMPDGDWQIEPPLECEIGVRKDGWFIESDLIKVSNCPDSDMVTEIFEELLREGIVQGKIRILKPEHQTRRSKKA